MNSNDTHTHTRGQAIRSKFVEWAFIFFCLCFISFQYRMTNKFRQQYYKDTKQISEAAKHIQKVEIQFRQLNIFAASCQCYLHIFIGR